MIPSRSHVYATGFLQVVSVIVLLAVLSVGWLLALVFFGQSQNDSLEHGVDNPYVTKVIKFNKP